ncbi:MAG TPA: hypothetical protein VLT15_00715 [Acidimicrobiia bacterium]|nr:hypothetical protein [Acidimicrobiia bacterium]
MTVLHDELMAIDGVAQAQVEIVDDGSPSVRLQVEPGADRRRVGELVQQILAKHGLRSRLAPEQVSAEPVAESPPEASVAVVETEPAVRPQVAPGGADMPHGLRRLRSVAVEEDRSSVVVTVRDDRGSSARAVGQPGRAALRDAVANAVFELIGEGGAPPSIVAIHRASEGDRQLITVVLDRGAGNLAVGSALVSVGWEYAFGRAIWAALTN